MVHTARPPDPVKCNTLKDILARCGGAAAAFIARLLNKSGFAALRLCNGTFPAMANGIALPGSVRRHA
jgi:hypothetical protein